jgi:NDP-sugar pyrophosphorylase family protein
MIGILPCAGEAKRIHGLPKYLLPCPPDDYLLNHHFTGMMDAGCDTVFMGANPENFSALTLQIKSKDAVTYRADKYRTMTETVLWMKEHGNNIDSVLFGMPDTYFDSPTVYEQLAYLMKFENDVVVAVCKARPDQHKQGGMVRLDWNGRVMEVIDKPETTDIQYIWGAMAWSPSFWNCLTPDMPHIGYGLPVAIERGLKVQSIYIGGNFWDCGTPERYFEMIRATTCAPQLA